MPKVKYTLSCYVEVFGGSLVLQIKCTLLIDHCDLWMLVLNIQMCVKITARMLSVNLRLVGRPVPNNMEPLTTDQELHLKLNKNRVKPPLSNESKAAPLKPKVCKLHLNKSDFLCDDEAQFELFVQNEYLGLLKPKYSISAQISHTSTLTLSSQS